MPLPWEPSLVEARHLHLRPAYDNCITLEQLTRLSDFLKRLCKTGLLRYTCDFSQEHGLHGERIRWTSLNMHNICQEVVRARIKKDNPCSWMEIVAPSSQPPDVFVSHNWSANFRDFMISIRTYSARHTMASDSKYFVCTFANNQWGVDLGDCLTACPFYVALRMARRTVLMLDRVGSALTRLWCIFEIATTLESGFNLTICMPTGIVGDPGTSSAPVVKSLEAADVRKAQASNEVDQRQILNSLGGVPEEEGIERVDGFKRLTSLTLHPAPKCGHKYRHEEELLDKKSEKFLRVNKQLRSFANSFGSTTASGCSIADPAYRSMTLAQLRELSKRVERECWDWHLAWESVCMRDVISHLFEPSMKRYASKSYMETVSSGAQKPDFLVTLPYAMPIRDVIAAIEWHAESRQLPDTATYWLQACALGHEEFQEILRTTGRTPVTFVLPHLTGQVVVLDGQASTLNRAGPCGEMYEVICHHLAMDLACASGVLATTCPLAEGWEFGSFDPKTAKHMLHFDVSRVTAADPAIADQVKCRIAGMPYLPGCAIPDDSPGLVAFNRRIQLKACGPILRDAAYRGSIKRLTAVLSQKTIRLRSDQLRGVLGETPLHAAVAGRRLEAVRMLLFAEADPNAQDSQGETPLHYAVLTGQGDIVRLLIRMGADTTIESYFSEVPEEVARQNPADFLAVDMQETATALSTSRLCMQSAALRVYAASVSADGETASWDDEKVVSTLRLCIQDPEKILADDGLSPAMKFAMAYPMYQSRKSCRNVLEGIADQIETSPTDSRSSIQDYFRRLRGRTATQDLVSATTPGNSEGSPGGRSTPRQTGGCFSAFDCVRTAGQGVNLLRLSKG
eukprot:TRINITY_DN17506_c0_g1_i2.p1 TRINITY_DN17506_c0_g1~~TRINITY_DN17506_c0_g1_i2.p1  ORF type:complete len:852 (+),score=130.63 TRINITY_DN17506_c0_g1_i2:152-2707(+)